MAKLEIPSIVRHSGCSAGGGDMEQHQKNIFHLAKQDELDLEVDQYVQSPIAINIEDKGGGQSLLDNGDRAESIEGSHNENEIHCEGTNCNGETSLHAQHSPVLTSPNSSVQSQNTTQEGRMERHKAGSRASRVKLLVRSQAVHDDTSPPPDLETVASNSNMLTVANGPATNSQPQSKNGKQFRTGGQGSSQSSIEGSSPALSRDSSTDTYTDSTGIDLQQFIIDTLHKNQKDRLMLLKLEQDLVIFVKDNTRQSYKFPQMSSYNRMLVHRVAAFFGLDHNVDQNGTAIIVNKTKNTRIPDVKFREQIKDELLPEEPKKCILRRDYASFEDYKESPERQSLDNRRSKSIEEREEEYVKARARIFNQEEGLGDLNLNYNQERMCNYCSSQEDLRWTNEHSWSSTDSDSSGKLLSQQGLKNGISEFEVQNGCTDKVTNVALLTKPDPSKESLTAGRSLRPAVTKASSFGGISLLTRESGSTNRKDSVPRLTKAESFNVASVSPNAADPQVSAMSATSPANKLSVSTHLSIQSQNSTFSQSSSHSSSSSPFLVAPSQPVQHLPVQLPSQPSSSWVAGARDSNLTLEFASVCSGQSVLPLSFVDTVPPGSYILNHPSGTSYLSDGAVYRQKNSPSQALIVTPLQMLNSPVTAHVPLLNQAASGSPLQAQHQLSQSLQQQQQQQQPFQGAYTVVYIPYIPSQIHSSLTQQPVTQMQGSHYQASSESKQYHHDTSGSHIDLVNQMANLNFLASQIPGMQSQDPISPGNGAEGTAPSAGNPPFVTQGYIVPTLKTSNFVGPQGNIGQTPVYFMPQLPYSSSVQPPRFVYPSDNIINNLASGPVPPTNVPLGNQGVREVPSQMISQPSNQPISGQQYMSGVSLFGVSQNAKSSAATPVINYTVTSQAGSSTVTTTTTSVLAPSGIPLQIYPFTNMLLANPSNSTPLLTTMASSQTVQVTNVIPPIGGHTPSTTVPLYLMNIANNSTTSANTTHLGNNVGSTFAAFGSQTPSSQNTASANPSATGSNHSMPGSSSYLNYAYTSPLQVSHLPQPTPAVVNPGTHASNTPGQLNPNLMAAFHVLRPGIPLVTNLRNTTPPPSIIQAAQFPTHSAKSTNKSNIAYPLTKLKDFSTADPHVLNTGFVNHDHQKGAQSNPLQFGNQEFHQPPGAIYRRGVPLMQDIRFLGHPLQHQINPLMLPRQHVASRNHPNVGHAPVSSRPSKMRKQRSKGNGLGKGGMNNTNGQSSTNSSGNSVLEVEGLPEGMKRSEVERYLEMVAALGAKIQFVCPEGSSGSSSDIVNSKCQVLAVFESGTAAQSALLNIKTTKFQLRPILKHGRGNCVKNF